MPEQEPECHDGSQEKWVSAEDGVLRETVSPPGPHWRHLLLLPLHSFITVLWSLPYRATGSWAGKCFSALASSIPAEPSTLMGMEMSNKYL